MPYHATHVIAQMQLLFFSALAFTWLKLSGIYPPELPSINIDAEWLYRRGGRRALRALAAIFDAADAQWRLSADRRLQALRSAALRSHGPGSLLADAWPTGRVVWLVIAALGSILIYSYL